MEEKALNFEVLLSTLEQSIRSIKDPRQRSNARQYQLRDLILSAFSVFFMQCCSFLSYQRQMESRWGQNNASTLFGLSRIPSDPQIRNVLDLTPSTSFYGIFQQIYRDLK
jgi:hypothetical protein